MVNQLRPDLPEHGWLEIVADFAEDDEIEKARRNIGRQFPLSHRYMAESLAAFTRARSSGRRDIHGLYRIAHSRKFERQDSNRASGLESPTVAPPGELPNNRGVAFMLIPARSKVPGVCARGILRLEELLRAGWPWIMKVSNVRRAGARRKSGRIGSPVSHAS